MRGLEKLVRFLPAKKTRTGDILNFTEARVHVVSHVVGYLRPGNDRQPKVRILFIYLFLLNFIFQITRNPKKYF